MKSLRFPSLLLFTCLCFTFSTGLACSIPVFRYALDRWHADNFRLELPAGYASNEKLAAFFRNLGADSPFNLEVKSSDDAAAPTRLLFPQSGGGAAPPVWEGKLDATSLAALTNSPARRELVRRILAGDSAVWVLLESGDRSADDALAKQIEKRLRFLESVAQLPRIDPSDPTSKLGPGPALRLKFSLLRVGAPASGTARNSSSPQIAGSETGAPSFSDESLFLKMLAGPKASAALASGPWLAVVFGRGRVLGAWPAGEFGDEQIEEACLFLLGSCSCQVKRQNPGWDLLLCVDWDKELQAASTAPLTNETTAARSNTNSNATVETVTISGGESSTPIAGANSHPWLLGEAGVCLLLGLALALRYSRAQP